MVKRDLVVERTQTGVRLEKRLLKVLKALADYHDLTLGDLLEGIVLHAFDGKCAVRQEVAARSSASSSASTASISMPAPAIACEDKR